MKIFKRISVATMTIFILICIFCIITLLSEAIQIPFVDLTYEKKKKIEYSIGIYVGKNPFNLYENAKITNPVLTAADVNDVEADFVADPFMILADTRWYMFFEVMNKNSGHGDVGLATSSDGYVWEYKKIILDEPFHLSYPFVFFWEGNYYMIPESHQTNSVRLYRATNFPFEWNFEKTLISEINAVDPTIFRYDGKWWLFTETDPKGHGNLELYWANEIFGFWYRHPQSPIIEGDENIARPAGRVIYFENKIFRVAQDDWPTYGNEVRIFQIDYLTTSEYIEHELAGKLIFESKTINTRKKLPKWRSDGMHHLDLHQIGEDNWIASVDGIDNFVLYKQLAIKILVPFTKKMR